jgi:putative component of membrane protein insertase Oxa1/YidC/SpoIIIJ protein YidD
VKQVVYICFLILFCNCYSQSEESNAVKLIGFYQKYISDIRGGNCPMYPSCSQYGLEVFEEEGVVMGFQSVPDRLMRCGHEHKLYSYTLTQSGFKLLDHFNEVENHEHIFSQEKFWPFSDTIIKISTGEKLIKDLIEKNYYSEALIEIRRFMLNDQEIPIEVYVNYLITLKALGKEESAIYEYEVIFPEEVKNNSEVIFKMAEICRSIGNTKLETEYLKKLNPANEGDITKVLLLRAASLAAQNDFSSARKILNDTYTPESVSLNRTILKLENFRGKREWAGAVGNIVPGLGYLYAGHKSTALSALILNSVLMYATYTNIEKGNNGMAILTGIFATSFYISGLSGGAKSVRRFNRQKETAIRGKLKLNYY